MWGKKPQKVPRLLIILAATDKICLMDNSKDITLGVLAHVDAGKTTLTEAMLYLAGKIKKLGRVDHRDSFLDTHSLERERGITIFSKQAVFEYGAARVTLLDTPGHVDFAAEAERTLSVLDCAVLVISGTDGVQAHTETLWRLLRRYDVPTFIFVTKMDIGVCDKSALMDEVSRVFGEGCVDFALDSAARDEAIALSSEAAMDIFSEKGGFDAADISRLIAARQLFPCYFGSGLRLDGVGALLDAVTAYAPDKSYPPELAARVYKIARDPQGQRMSFIKLTGGSLSVRAPLSYADEGGNLHEEKISQLRIYSGIKYEAVESVHAGQVCAVLGLSATYPGQGLGAEAACEDALLESVMSYTLRLPQGVDARLALPKLMLLQEEDPKLRLVWDERSRSISVRLMGRVQAEVFKRLIKDRFDLDIALDSGRIMYRETISDKVEGVGHFEPLRHYAEVHLVMEALPPGSGIVVDSVCSEDELDRNWQRLILSHVLERPIIGVLTGSPVTDVKITLAAGRAHLKHTEGGDFRQATYRALRQGLMQAKSVLLEPYYAFSLDTPPEQLGRAISDLRMMNAEFSSPEAAHELMRIDGVAPVAAMNGYMEALVAYTHGRGRLSLRPDGYRPCRNSAAVIADIGYDASADLENTADSVFCAHGAGFNVSWDKVADYMHLDSVLRPAAAPPAAVIARRSISIDERELEAIMEREFGAIKRPVYSSGVRNSAPPPAVTVAERRQYVIVDGYNLIFAWAPLKAYAADSLDLARARLLDVLSGFAGYTRAELVVVFDAYRTPGNRGSRGDYHNIRVAYTADGETADMYIERLANDIGKNYDVRVVTSDNLIRLSALRSGVLRTSSREFIAELEWTMAQIDAVLLNTNKDAHMTRLKDGKG